MLFTVLYWFISKPRSWTFSLRHQQSLKMKVQLDDRDPAAVRAPAAFCPPLHSPSHSSPSPSPSHRPAQIIFTLLSSPLLVSTVSDCGTVAVAREAGKEIKETNDTWRHHLGGQRTMSSYCDYARAIVNMCFCWVYIHLHMFQNSPGDGKPLGTMLAFPITIRHVFVLLSHWMETAVCVRACLCVREEGGHIRRGGELELRGRS